MFDEKEYNYSKLIPFVYWAQNKDTVFLKFELADIDNNNFKLLDNTLFTQFLCKKTELIYEFNLKLFGDVEDEGQYFSNERAINIILKKKEEGYWDRLGSDKSDLKMHIKVNWDLWREEDDEEEAEQGSDSNFDYESMMQQMMGGMGGMGGMEGLGGMSGMEGLGNMGDFNTDEEGDDEEGDDEEGDDEEGDDEDDWNGDDEADDEAEEDCSTKVINTENVSELLNNIEYSI